MYMYVYVLSHFSLVRLFVTLWTVACQAPLSTIFQARMLEWVAVPSSRMFMYMHNIFTEQVWRFYFASNFLIITSISFLHFVYGNIFKRHLHAVCS